MHDLVGYSYSKYSDWKDIFELMFRRQYRLMRFNDMYISGFHNNAIAKNRYDNRGMPIQHHLPQARHSGSYIPALIRMEMSHNSATIDEAPKRQKSYSLFTGLGDHVRLHHLLETNPFWQKEC